MTATVLAPTRPAGRPTSTAGRVVAAAGTAGRLVRRWWRPALLGGGAVFAAVELRSHLPSVTSIWGALRQAGPGWLLAAVVCQVVSMAAFSEQQRRLLAALGVRITARASLSMSYTRSAMATALPAGSAVSAGYAFRQFRTHGASQPIAAAVMLLSGVASLVGLVVLYATDALTWIPGLWSFAIVVPIAAITVHWVRSGPATPAAVNGVEAAEAELSRTWWRRLRRTLRETAALARTVSARHWLRVVVLAAVNWLTDLAGLLAAVHAVGLSISTEQVAAAYLAAQLVRQIPITPGGIGVIEASLILALTAAGAAAAPATAAVLIYRLLSSWALVPIGLACWTAQKHLRPLPAIPQWNTA